MRRLRALLRVPHDDDGVGLILVIGTATVAMALVMVTASIATRALAGGREHDTFAASLAVAETGVEQGIARVQAAYDKNGSDYLTPHTTATAFDPSPDCAADESLYAYTLGAGATNAQETAWAKARMQTLATIPGCLHTTARGQYVLLKPDGRQTVYAMGWSPRYGAKDARVRMIKSEYIFAPYKPANAILTGGDLAIESSSDVQGVTGTTPASVHSNGSITVQGNPTVTGKVSWAGTGPEDDSVGNFLGGRGQSPKQSIPTINATTLYAREVNKNLGSWYDLCPDGQVRQGSSTGVPCTGAVLRTTTASPLGNYRGWTFDGSTTPPTWRSGTILPGIYYASEANVRIGNGADLTRGTIIASSVQRSPECLKSGGNIDYYGHLNIAVPFIPGLFLYADQDLQVTENVDLGSATGGAATSGAFIAGDQVEVTTSSSHFYGSVIAGDECPGVAPESRVQLNKIKNPDVFYDPNGYVPLTDVVNTTLWLELTG